MATTTPKTYPIDLGMMSILDFAYTSGDGLCVSYFVGRQGQYSTRVPLEFVRKWIDERAPDPRVIELKAQVLALEVKLAKKAKRARRRS